MAIKMQNSSLVRSDGWANVLTGQGIKGTDKKESTSFSARSFMVEWELNELYIDNGFAKRVVNLLPEDMLRAGFYITNDKDNQVESKLEDIHAMKEIDRLLKWNRLFGGAVMVMGIDDGALDLKEPLNEKNIRDLIFVRTYDRYRVTWSQVDLYTDPKNPKYGKPQFYHIWPINGMPGFTVHETRCIVRDGIDIPEYARVLNNYWGASYLQHCYDQLRAVGNIYNGLESIIDDFVFGTLSIKNLSDMMYAPGGDKLVKDRLELMDLSRHIINTVLLDADAEKYEKHASSISGLAEIVDKFFLALSMVTGIPQRILTGSQEGGLNNKGEGETTDWNNQVLVNQELDLKPILERLTTIVYNSKMGPTKGVEPDEWSVVFNPLEEMNEKDEATIRKTNAEADKIYIDSGVLDAAEVALSRFGGEEYGYDIKLISDRTAANELGGGAAPSESELLALEAQKKALKAPIAPLKPKTVR